MRQPKRSKRTQWAFCERSGLKYPVHMLTYEPGTGLLVSKKDNDGIWNRVTTPQNDPLRASPTEFQRRPKYSRYEDEVITVGTVLVVEEDGEILPLNFNGVYLMVKDE